MKTPPFIAAGTIGLALFAGCGGGDKPADGSSKDAYDAWAEAAKDKLPPDQVPLFVQAQQEIRLEIMGPGGVNGQTAIDTAFLKLVDGKSVHDITVLGLNDRVARLTAFIADATQKIASNQLALTKASDRTPFLQTIDMMQDAKARAESDLQAAKDGLAKLSVGAAH